ncbi:cytochrome P450 [Catenulispora yoronensis]
MDPPGHTHLRRILIPGFTIKTMRQFEPSIREIMVGALDAMRAAGQPADLINEFALPAPSMVISRLLGVPYEDHDFFQSRSRVIVDRSFSPEQRGDASQAVHDYLADLVARKQSEGESHDLIGRLAIDRVAAGELTTEEVVGVALMLFMGGHETTANMIGLSTLVLLRYPELRERLRQRPALVDNLVEELLRYVTILRTGVPRLATADVEIGGQLIRAGEGAIAMTSAANRDLAVYSDPDQFDVDREPHPHLAFGFGVHQCIAQPLARIEIRVALTELIQRFPALALAEEVCDADAWDDAVVYGLRRMMVRW